MKSNVCVFKKSVVELENILVETDKIAQYNNLNKKETSTHFQSKDLTQSKTRFLLEMKRATRLSHMAVHDTKPAS